MQSFAGLTRLLTPKSRELPKKWLCKWPLRLLTIL
jgi:hypothetical protein